jgi:hypothetical protein
MTDQIFTPDAPTVSAPTVEAITSTTALQTAFKLAPAPMVKPTVSTDMSKAVAQASKSAMKGMGSGVPGSMSGRMGGTARMAAMKKAGGKEKAEKAVMAGLRWLKKNQNEDGSWAPTERAAMTGLGVLCFLGHGELPDSPEFGPTIKKALDFMLAKGTEFQGKMSMTRDGWGGTHGVYHHAIGTYAMCEYYTMTKDERFAELVKQSIGYIVQGQAPDGGWQYNFAKGADSDTSVSGWMIQALKAAHLTGLGITGVDEALDKAMLNLKRVQDESGHFGYRKAGDRKGELDGVGVLCTYFWKQDKDKSVRDGIEALMRRHEDKDWEVKYKGENANLYGWYYNTQACLMFGGSAWTKWNRWFQDEVADAQSPDGSWPPCTSKMDPGNHLKKPDGDGPYYRTTLCILMLEVFYRYMPVTK